VHEHTVEVHQAKDGQRLIVNTLYVQVASVSTDGLEQGDDCAHTRAVDQSKWGQIHENVRGPLFADPANDGSELSDGHRIKLTFDTKGGRAILVAEI
jgi:hypothetical protein